MADSGTAAERLPDLRAALDSDDPELRLEATREICRMLAARESVGVAWAATAPCASVTSACLWLC